MLHRTDVFYNITDVTLYANKTPWRNITQFQVISMYKHLVQQNVQQEMHNNYVALLIKRFVFIRLVESIY